MLAILSSHEAQRKIDFRVRSHMCRLLCHPDKPVGMEELRIRGHRTSGAGPVMQASSQRMWKGLTWAQITAQSPEDKGEDLCNPFSWVVNNGCGGHCLLYRDMVRPRISVLAWSWDSEIDQTFFHLFLREQKGKTKMCRLDICIDSRARETQRVQQG